MRVIEEEGRPVRRAADGDRPPLRTAPPAPAAAPVALLVAGVLLLPASLPPPGDPVRADGPPAGPPSEAALPAARPDTTDLADGPFSRMTALLERTIFKVDVLRLEMRFGEETAERLREVVTAPGRREVLADSAARVALGAPRARVRVRFVRDVGLERFLDGIRENLRPALEAGWMEEATYRLISDSLPVWYRPLEGRGVKEGDEMVYDIRGDTLRTTFRGRDREVLLDQTDVGPERTRAVLASYLAPGSDFREELLDSLFGPG